MSDIEDQVSATRRADESTAVARLWARRFGCLLLAVVPVAALFNVFGQRSSTATLQAPALTLSVHAPHAVRAGLLFQTKIAITAKRKLPDVTLLLGNGWFDGLTLNTEEPSASSETNGPDGGVVLSLGTLQPGQPYVQYLEYQVNPTSIGRRHQAVEVSSAGAELASVEHTMTVIP
jgi:hypothetical protein